MGVDGTQGQRIVFAVYVVQKKQGKLSKGVQVGRVSIIMES